MPTNVQRYRITFRIGQNDLSPFLKRIKINNNIKNTYCNVIFAFDMGIREYYIDNDFYGKSEIIFKIDHLDIEKKVIDTYGFVLGIVSSNLSLVTQQIGSFADTDATYENATQEIIVVCIPLLAVNKLGTLVNYVSSDDTKLTALETVRNVAKNLAKINIEKIDMRNQNTQQLRQVCIPPMSINKLVPFMNSNYGLYNGPLFYYCDHYGNLMMWNLKTIYNDNPAFVIHQQAMDRPKSSPPLDEKINNLIADFSRKEGNFMSMMPIDTLKLANATVIKNSYRHMYVYHPPYDLYGTGMMSAEELVKQSCFVDDKDKNKPTMVNNHELLKVLKRYTTNTTGDTVYSETQGDVLIKANESLEYATISPLRVKVNGVVRFSFFLTVGTCCDLITYAQIYKQFEGKYILGQSSVDLTRDHTNEWTTNCRLLLYRSL
jgi:hypothetical protein